MSDVVANVELDGISVRAGAVVILRDVRITIAPGERVGIYGPNGAGKTTLLRVMATLLPPVTGRGRVLGVGLDDAGRFEVRRHIGYVGHVPALYPELTLAENLRFAARLGGVPEGRVAQALAAVGLADAGDRPAAVCSHGMQRRAEFARELMLDRRLLLLDEPQSALDPDAVALVDHVIASVAGRGGSAVLVSHDRARVGDMVDRWHQVTAGTLVA